MDNISPGGTPSTDQQCYCSHCSSRVGTVSAVSTPRSSNYPGRTIYILRALLHQVSLCKSLLDMGIGNRTLCLSGSSTRRGKGLGLSLQDNSNQRGKECNHQGLSSSNMGRRSRQDTNYFYLIWYLEDSTNSKDSPELL